MRENEQKKNPRGDRAKKVRQEKKEVREDEEERKKEINDGKIPEN